MGCWSESIWLRSISGAALVGGLLLTSLVAAYDKDKDKDRDRFVQSHNVDRDSTLSWDKALPAAQRFVVLPAFGNAAVLDRNTGLVWDRAANNGVQPWFGAIFGCANKQVGGTVGWRLPSVIELKSLQTPSLPAPFVPGGVFVGVQLGPYWAASTSAQNPDNAWIVDSRDGAARNDINKGTMTNIYFWCVRGPIQESVY